MKFSIFFILMSMINSLGYAKCRILKSNNQVVGAKSDALFMVLADEQYCPVKRVIESKNLNIESFMVANRGRNNPKHGSFSIFESVSGGFKTGRGYIKVSKGMFYFGHFTTLKDRQIVLDQSPSRSKLLIELIVWDYTQRVFNFYELLSINGKSIWFYRGNSKDVYLDKQKLHLQKDPSRPQFGKRLRCSACHISGGPIMKELEAPHNDWWSDHRNLLFYSNNLSGEVGNIVKNLKGARLLSGLVKKSINTLNLSKEYWSFKMKSSVQEILRPLFCTQEINLISDKYPLSSPKVSIDVSLESFVNPLIFSSNNVIRFNKKFYTSALSKMRSRFENGGLDGDHAFLTPVKGYSDIMAIKDLVKKNFISKEFVSDILAVDFKNPLFSKGRCSLLKLVPNVSNWMNGFIQNLKASKGPYAKKSLENIFNKTRNLQYHSKTAAKYLGEVANKASSLKGVESLVKELFIKRDQVKSSEISQNPMGQILEPGFRVIFPVIK